MPASEHFPGSPASGPSDACAGGTIGHELTRPSPEGCLALRVPLPWHLPRRFPRALVREACDFLNDVPLVPLVKPDPTRIASGAL